MTDLRIEDIGVLRDFIVLSDIHLRDPKEPKMQRLLNLLPGVSTEAVIFLGDIFDFIAFHKDFFILHYLSFFKACQALQERGIKVYFVEGNHDFGLEHFFKDSLKTFFVGGGDCELRLRHPLLGTFALRHGDDVICPKSYIPFRRVIKSKAFQTCSTFLMPGFLMHKLFNFYASLSRQNEHYRPLSQDFLLTCLTNYLNHDKKDQEKPTHLVLGHIHKEVDLQLDHTRVLIGPDWDSKPNFLHVQKDGKITRIFL
jgi:UDP-2,3-diacylglucosamine pyrophosphatase LpxH